MRNQITDLTILTPGHFGERLTISKLKNGSIALSAMDSDFLPDPNQTFLIAPSQATQMIDWFAVHTNYRPKHPLRWHRGRGDFPVLSRVISTLVVCGIGFILGGIFLP